MLSTQEGKHLHCYGHGCTAMTPVIRSSTYSWGGYGKFQRKRNKNCFFCKSSQTSGSSSRKCLEQQLDKIAANQERHCLPVSFIGFESRQPIKLKGFPWLLRARGLHLTKLWFQMCTEDPLPPCHSLTRGFVIKFWFTSQLVWHMLG